MCLFQPAHGEKKESEIHVQKVETISCYILSISIVWRFESKLSNHRKFGLEYNTIRFQYSA